MPHNPITDSRGIADLPCPMCRSEVRSIWMQDGKPTRYVRCRACKTVYASPKAPYASRYAWLDASFGVGENAQVNAQSRQPALTQEAQVIQQYIQRGRLLDVGCDLGDFFAGFPDPDWQRHGVELSPSAAAYAAEHYAAQVLAGTLLQADYPAQHFDLVTLIDVIYYLDDPAADFQEMYRVLRPGGWLAIEVSGQTYQLLRSRGILCWLTEGRWTRLQTDSAYLFWPSVTALRAFLGRCGFEIVTWHGITSPQQPNAIMRATANLYTRLVSAVTPYWPTAESLAPKILYLARRRG